jgi:putative ABC transport system permease protein
MGALDIGYGGLAAGYLLLIIPLGVMLWFRIPIFGQTLVAILRMTVQLLFVGLYLQVLFRINNPWLNALWLIVMITVADVSILHACGLRVTRFARPVFFSLAIGTIIPLLFFLCVLLPGCKLTGARYLIPIAGMILGNCLRADIIGVRTFYQSIRTSNRFYLQRLAAGATQAEAVRPFLREACRSALAPTVATMTTIGLVALPGMMTGVILGGTDPFVAIKYQIAIMIAIFSGTAITVVIAILLTLRTSFTEAGVLDLNIFARGK